MRNSRRVVALEKAMRPTRLHIVEFTYGSSEEGAIKRYQEEGNEIFPTDTVVLLTRFRQVIE